LLCFVSLSLGGCRTTTMAPPPKDPVVKPLRVEHLATVVESPGSNGLVTMARPMLARATVGDPLSLIIHWQLDTGWIRSKHPIAKRKFSPRDLAASLVIRVESPTGRESKHSLAKFGPSDPVTLDHENTLELLLNPREADRATGYSLAMRSLRVARGWAAAPPVLDRPGTYWITVEGEIPFADGAERFSAGPVPIQLVAPSAEFLDTRGIYERAKAIVIEHTGSDESFQYSRRAVDLPSGNRLFRLGRDAGDTWGMRTIWEVEMTPAGELIGIRTSSRRMCIAEDTLVETDSGAKPVQELAVGEQVWAYDTSRKRKVLTPVEAVVSNAASSVLVINDNLRVTPEHPVYVDGRWIRAGNLRAGQRLLRFDLASVTSSVPQQLTAQTVVYDVSVGWPHNFFAAGWLVHNKSFISHAVYDNDWYQLFTRFEE
jgi:hypothetical protein